jgi:Mrp family chromosome partitioning ATPase
MDKIQSAIAKARAQRDEKAVEQDEDQTIKRRATTPTAAPPPPQASQQATAAWDALPGMEIDPRLLKRNRIVSAEGGHLAVGIDMMRTRVLQQMRDNSWSRLAITSPTVACGKSTVALNLAMSLQRQSNLRIILMEIDLRRPSLARMCGITRAINVVAVLQGSGSFADNAVCCAPNLAISTASHSHRNAAELLSSPSVPEALSQIEALYAPDIIIFDTPPMLMTDDMMAVARHVDCALLVAGAESTTIKEIDICERELASQTNVMGMVLNKCRYMDKEHDYGYYD